MIQGPIGANTGQAMHRQPQRRPKPKPKRPSVGPNPFDAAFLQPRRSPGKR